MKTIKLVGLDPINKTGDMDIFLFVLDTGKYVQLNWEQAVFQYINYGYTLISYFVRD